ncbi:MAG: TonB-dependent receptor [Desulfuromonadales bacterium]|nr:TonB-dependent receptor [Desulfuromonadales bacterium]
MAEQAPVISEDELKPFPLLGSTRQVTSGTAFNPAISVILDGKYYNDNVSGEGSEILEEAQGFEGDHDEAGHGHGELARGLNLGGTEIVFSASVDNYFDALVNLAVDGDGIEVEEAFGLTRGLPAGLQLKFGKFLSGIGYFNQLHPHAWAFADQNLPYRLIFGEENLNEVGLQLTWLPAWPVYTLIGVEALQGSNEKIAASDLDIPAGFEGRLKDRAGPRLFTGFIKIGPDLGPDHALQWGLFGGFSRLHQEEHGDEFLEGESWFTGTDLVYKFDAGGSHGKGNLVLQGEYIYRVKELEVAAHATEPLAIGEEEKFTQDGLYLQGTYGFAPRWTAGLRYEMAGLTNDIKTDAGTEKLDDSKRYSAAITFNPTEFSRLRLQFNRADIATDQGREKYNQVFLQYQLALGVHGAHRF